jgi:hypothetical protein
MDLVFLEYGSRKNYLNPFIGRDENEGFWRPFETLLERVF